MRWRARAVIFLLMLFFTAATSLQGVSSGENPSPNITVIAMPEEFINYTVTAVNGSVWAKIDGAYPISILVSPEPLVLLYPIPPETTNISLKINGTELNWDNFTEIYPEELHVTALGNWPMINCTINPVPEHFALSIHYEHPVKLINGSYTFLYDLNVSPYLSEWSTRSTAYFTILMETDYTSFNVNAVSGDGTLIPISYAAKTENTTKKITFPIVSEYTKPILGDILVTFKVPNESNGIEVIHLLFLLLAAIIAAVIAYKAYKIKRADKQ